MSGDVQSLKSVLKNLPDLRVKQNKKDGVFTAM